MTPTTEIAVPVSSPARQRRGLRVESRLSRRAENRKKKDRQRSSIESRARARAVRNCNACLEPQRCRGIHLRCVPRNNQWTRGDTEPLGAPLVGSGGARLGQL